MVNTRKARIRALVFASAVSIIGIAGSTNPAHAAQLPPPVVHQGFAFGTQLTVGSTLNSGPTAFVTIGCSTASGLTRTNNVAGVSLPPLGSVGAVTDTMTTDATSTTAMSQIAGASLLGGMIQAQAITATSTTSRSATGFTTQGATTLLGLVIGGQAIASNPAPNTRVALPGIGSVTLNEQTSSIAASSASMVVRGIHVRIRIANALGFPVGADLIVADAKSGLVDAVNGTLDGVAYGTQLMVGATITSGPTALEVMPCIGTNGVVRTNSTAAVNLATLLSAGAVVSTAQGTVDATVSQGETTNTIANVKVLTAVVSATTIKADAHAQRTLGVATFSDAGSSFVHLNIAGFPLLGDNVAANTTLSIPGIGTLYLHRVIQTANQIEVRMIELITNSPIPGVPIGTDLRIGVARASVH